MRIENQFGTAMRKELFKKILFGMMSIATLCIFSAAQAQIQSQSWPSRLFLDADVLARGNEGDILAEVGVSMVEPWETVKYTSGVAYLSIDGHEEFKGAAPDMSDKGVFAVSADGSVGVAFIGSMKVCVRDMNTCEDHSNKQWNGGLKNDMLVLWGDVPDSLIRVKSPDTSVSLQGHNTWISLTGRVVLVRLNTASISVNSIVLPNIKLEFNGQFFSGIVDKKSTNILSTTQTELTAKRSCNVQLSGSSINFGDISAVVPAKAGVLRSGKSLINVQCRGISDQETLVTMSLRSASGYVTSDSSSTDLSSIPMNNSNDLVVKATFSESVPACTSNEVLASEANNVDVSKWLDVTGATTYKISTIAQSETEANVSKNLNWHLCRRAYSGPLDPGDYSASAVLTITLN